MIQQKRDVQKQIAACEKTLILEMDKKPGDAQTIEDIDSLFVAGYHDPLSESKRTIKLHGQLVSYTKSTINPETNKTIPAKIVLKGSTKTIFPGVVYSKRLAKQLAKLVLCWIVIDSIYFKQAKDNFICRRFFIYKKLQEVNEDGRKQ